MLDRDLEPDHDPSEDFVRRDELPDFDRIRSLLDELKELPGIKYFEGTNENMNECIEEIRDLLGEL